MRCKAEGENMRIGYFTYSFSPSELHIRARLNEVRGESVQADK